MKDRLHFSPKHIKYPDNYDTNFRKSPKKYILLESVQTQNPPPNHQPTAFNQFDHLKKVPEESAALRQTMNSKLFARLQKDHIFQAKQEEKGNKLNDFLRQTFSSKTSKAYSETLIPDNAYSGSILDRNKQQNKNTQYYQTYRIQPRKGGSEQVIANESLREYDKISDKINRNKQLIEELKKVKQESKDGLLKNVNYMKPPAFIQLDSKKQQKEALNPFKKEDANNYYLTPKIDKGNYQNRFNSSPPEQLKPKDEPAAVASISKLKKKASLSTSLPPSSLIDQFMVDKKLGEGKFGCVNLAIHRKTNSLFALKKIPKALIKSHLMIDQLILEIRIQTCIKNPNILEMYGFFDDKTHLYIVLEYMSGGTLYQRMKKQKMKEKQASSIIRQITSAIDCLHDSGIAHRDIKPENIVISNNVYKLCDFGWAAICNERRKTYCGTFDYVAPQILEGAEYDMSVDLWCLGVLTFQLLTGKAPFYHISRKQTMKKILNVENEMVVYPEGMSEEARDFIDKLIRKNPLERITASQALLHPFLEEKDEQG